MSFYIQSKKVKKTLEAPTIQDLKDLLDPGLWYVLDEDGKEFIVEVSEC